MLNDDVDLAVFEQQIGGYRWNGSVGFFVPLRRASRVTAAVALRRTALLAAAALLVRSLIQHIDIELVNADVLFRKAIAQRVEVVEQGLSRCLRFDFQPGRQRSAFDLQLDVERAKMRRR
mgnify:CR=1 FL=1